MNVTDMETSSNSEQLVALRKRWTRWLNAVCRADRDGWINLLDASWQRWLSLVMGEEHIPLHYMSSRQEVKVYYQQAINRASERLFARLDALYVSEKASKR